MVTFDIDKYYTCGLEETDEFTVDQFPPDFGGTRKPTLGFWFQYKLENASLGWITLYKLTSDYSENFARHPACYLSWQSSTTTTIVCNMRSNEINYGSQVNYTFFVLDKWYFMSTDVDLDQGVTNFRILDASKTSASDESQLIAYDMTAANINFTGFSYESPDYKLLLAGDIAFHNKSCMSIWQLFMITGFIPSQQDLYLLAFCLTLISQKYAVQPYNVYQNMFDYSESQDDTLLLVNENSPWLSWSANRQSYSFILDPSEMISPALRLPLSFLHPNGTLFVSVRITFKIIEGTQDTCSTYWLLRRISTSTSQTIFGIGISKGHGLVTIQKSTTDIQSDSGQIDQPKYTFNTWETLYVGCYEQWLSVTLCLFFFENDRSNRYHLRFDLNDIYNENANGISDTLWLGSSTPGSAVSSTTTCGTTKIVSLSINQGHLPLPLDGDGCYGGCQFSITSNNDYCYVLDSSSSGGGSASCPSQTAQIPNHRDCIPCPLGCSACTFNDQDNLNTVCTECQQNYTLTSSSSSFATNSFGICSCAPNYYFAIDSITNQGLCVPKTHIAVSITQAGSSSFSFNVEFPIAFYSRQSDLSTLLSSIRVALNDEALSTATLTAVTTNRISLSFSWMANIEVGSNLRLNFSAFNQIEGLTLQVLPSTVSYTYTTGYIYLDDQTLATLQSIGEATAIGSIVQNSGADLISLISGGVSSAAIFLLDAIGELELYKYLNIEFPANFIAFYESLYSGNNTSIPNVFATIKSEGGGDNNNVATTSTYYKFSEWNTPIVFLDKCGDGLAKQIVALALCLLTPLPVLFCLKKDDSSKMERFFTRLNHIFRWNMVISYFLGDFTTLIVHIMVQFQELSFSNLDNYSIASVVVSVLILTAYAIIFAVAAYQVNKKRLTIPYYFTSARKKLKKRIEKDKFPVSMAVFQEEYNEDNRFDKNFMFVMKFQDLLVCVNFFFLQRAPLAQCYVYTLLIGYLIIITLIVRPSKSLLSMIGLLFNEFGKLVLGILAIIIASDKQTGHLLSQDMMLVIGKAQIYTVITIFAGNIVLTLVIIGGEILKLIRSMKSKKRGEHRKLAQATKT